MNRNALRESSAGYQEAEKTRNEDIRQELHVLSAMYRQ
jgi:hypothetical protein